MAVIPQGNKAFLIPAATGLAALFVLHFFFVMTWQRLFASAGIHDAWWLNSGYSVSLTVVMLFVVAYVVLSHCRPTLVNALAMWVGVDGEMGIAVLAAPREEES